MVIARSPPTSSRRTCNCCRNIRKRGLWAGRSSTAVRVCLVRQPVLRKHGKPTTLRQVVPLLFFLAMTALVIAGAWLRQPAVAGALPLAYGAAMVGLGISLVRRRGWLVASLVPVAVVTMHLAYAA